MVETIFEKKLSDVSHRRAKVKPIQLRLELGRSFRKGFEPRSASCVRDARASSRNFSQIWSSWSPVCANMAELQIELSQLRGLMECTKLQAAIKKCPLHG